MANKVKIDKRVAKRLYEEGKTVFVLPHKVRLVNMWIAPHQMNKSDIEKLGGNERKHTFEHRVNNYVYYNCNSELGYYPAYYIEEADNVGQS